MFVYNLNYRTIDEQSQDVNRRKWGRTLEKNSIENKIAEYETVEHQINAFIMSNIIRCNKIQMHRGEGG